MIFSVAFQNYQGAEHQADIFTFPPAAPSQPNWPALSEVDFFSFYPRKMDKRPVRAQSGRQHPCRLTVQAVLASLAAILMLICVCGFARRRTEHTGFVSRKLADDKPNSPGGAEVCGDPQGESGMSSDEEARPLTLRELLEPSAKKPKIVPGEGEGDQAPAGPSGLAPPPKQKQKVPAKLKVPSGRPYQAGPHPPVQELEEAQTQPDVPAPSKPPGKEPPKSGSHEGMGPVPQDASSTFAAKERSPAEMTAAQALLLLQQPAAVSGASPDEGVQQEEDIPGPSASRAESPQLPGPSTPARPLQALFRAAAPADLDDYPPVPGLYPPSLVPPDRHPFFNLPTLQSGVVPRQLNLNRACSYGISVPAPHDLLNEMRALLAKDLLSQQDADALVDALERVLSHCYHHQRSEVTATRYEGRAEKRHRGLQISKHELLASALSKAVGTLKRGVRLSNSTTFRLKYMLFCSSRGTERLNIPIYGPWRGDCPDNSGGSQEGSSAE